jgi:hypothetical protein
MKRFCGSRTGGISFGTENPIRLQWHSLHSLPFQGQKSLDFQGPPFPTALVMDLPAPKALRPAPYL